MLSWSNMLKKELEQLDKNIQKIIDETDQIIANNFRKKVNISYKSENGTYNPVTEVDLEIEAKLKSFLSDKYPKFGFLGEESEHEIKSEYTFIIDPIDGTTNFSSGIPLCGTVLVLFFKDQPIYTIQSFPLLHERVVGCNNLIQLNGDSIEKTNVKRRLRLAYENSGSNEERAGLVLRLAQNGIPVERYGSSAFDTNLVATNRIDVVVLEKLAAWDIAATLGFASCCEDLAVKTLTNHKIIDLDNKNTAYKHTVVFGKKECVEQIAMILDR